MESDNVTPLCEIAYKYRTDKCPQIGHMNTVFYYELLKDKRELIKKVVEIGTGCQDTMHRVKNYKTGASLFMWREFLPNAQIYGADIVPETVFKDERIETFLCDTRKKKDLMELIKKTGTDIDLFIDDGSHKAKNQIFVCKTIMPLLKKDVIYIIEDIKRDEDLNVVNALDDYHCQVVVLPYKGKHEMLIVVRNK